jgi:hypothetical protein
MTNVSILLHSWLTENAEVLSHTVSDELVRALVTDLIVAADRARLSRRDLENEAGDLGGFVRAAFKAVRDKEGPH